MNNDLSPQTIENKNDHTKWNLKSSSWLGRGTQIVMELNRLMVSQLSPSNNWISNVNKDGGSERVVMIYADFSEREITDFDIIHIYIHHAKNNYQSYVTIYEI